MLSRPDNLLSMSDESTAPRRALRQRPARRGDERELALLRTAERLLVDEGFATASLSQIAAEAGVSRPGFYFYFASKEALLSTLIVRTLDTLVDSLAPPSAGEVADPVTALRLGLRTAADLWHDHRAVLMAASELGSGDPAMFDRVISTHRALVAPTSDLLRQGSRVHSPADARALAEMFTWMAERNFYMLSRERPSRRRLRARANRMLDVWVTAAGLDAPRPSANPRDSPTDDSPT
jgi:AcrR family transcriptional regulator